LKKSGGLADEGHMKLSTGLCIAMAFGGILMGALMGGTSPASFIDMPALLIIFLGTLGTTGASVGPETMGNIVPLYKVALKTKAPPIGERVALLVSLAEQARREGLLALDERVNQIDDEFTRKGLQLVVDGIDPDLVRDVLEAEIDGMIARHHHGAAMFQKAGGFAPTMGIVGTVMGLVHVLQNLSAPSTLGPAISSAFVATLLGIGSANVIYLPIAGRLEGLSKAEVELRTLTLDGILAVQAGDNPRVVAEKLNSYIAPIDRVSEDDEPAAPAGERERAEAA
jgi:chemotaxis protein MotA